MKNIARSLLTALALVGGASFAEEIKKAEPASGQAHVEIGPVSIAVSVSSSDSANPAKAAWLGVVTGPVSPQLRAQLDLAEGMGLSVEAVAKDSPAEKAGLKKYDVLKKFNDQMLCAQDQLAVLVKSAGKNAKVSLVVLRGGKEQNMTVTLGEHDAPDNGKAQFSVNGIPGINIEVQDIEKFFSQGLNGDFPAKSFGFTFPGGSASGSVSGSATAVPGGIHKNWDEMQKKKQQQQKEVQAQIDAAMKKAQDEAKKAGEAVQKAGAAQAQVFSIYPNSQSSSAVTIVDSDGTIEINDTNGKRSVKIKDSSGKEIYSAQLNTPADHDAVPENFRAKVKDAEAKIKTGSAGDFKKKPMKRAEPQKAPGGTI